MSVSTSSVPNAVAGPSGQNPHPLLENNEEKNRQSSPFYHRNLVTDIYFNPSVVIKVGMVGDSQIGKTSLMVKYVEGSFDEDYIQTLGMTSAPSVESRFRSSIRRQLHGKNYIRPPYYHHIFDMGFGRSARVRQHVTTGLQ